MMRKSSHKAKRRFLRSAALAAIGASLLTASVYPTKSAQAAANPVISLDAGVTGGNVSHLLFGANHRYLLNGVGMYDSANHQVYPDFQANYEDAGLTVMRYPGGTVANTFWWQRAVGPAQGANPESGVNEIHGGNYSSQPADFSLDQALKFAEATGTALTYMYNVGNGNPADAANLVQYLNGTDTNNAYVQMRIKNGHSAPYNVKYFEMGNEIYLGAQRYWLSGIPSGADYRDYYVNGGDVSFAMQPVVLKSDWTSLKGSYKSTGVSGQQVYAAYAPIDAGSDTVYVNGTAWTRVSNLSAYGASDQVYKIDAPSGLITFGDGTHGKVPPAGQTISVSYSAYHRGYKDYVTAMKEVDPTVRVISSLNDAATRGILDSAGVQYDGMAIHPYTGSLPANLDLADFYGYVMHQAASVSTSVKNLQNALKNDSHSNGIVFPSEYGIMSPTNPTGGADYQASLGQALYLAKIQMSFMSGGVPIATKHSLIDAWGGRGQLGWGDQALFDNNYTSGGSYNFTDSPSAQMFKLLTHMTGSTLVSSPAVANMPTYTYTNNGNTVAQNALDVVATEASGGDLYVLVLNEDPANAYSTTLHINNYAPNSTAAVWKLGENNVLNQTNTAGQPLGVAIQTSSLAVTGSSFSYTFPAHTLTAIHLTGTVSVSSPQPAAYYKLDETSGTAAADSSGSGHTAGWVATSGGSLSWDPSGKINGALRIAPASGGSYGSYYLSIPNTFDPAATDFTVAAWVKLSQAAGAGANQSIFSQEGAGGRNLLYRDVDSGKLKSYLGGIATASVGTIPLGTWTHVALVNHAGTITLYVNGSADTTASVSPEASAGSFRLGANKNPTAINANWNGDLDDVRIYTSALSATQISKIYTGLAP